MSSSLASKSILGSTKPGSSSSFSPDLRRLSSPAVLISIRSQPKKNLQIQATGSSYGTHFRVSTFGESHGGGVGCIIDGCPPRIPLSESNLQFDLDRRRPGQSRITTPRKETDTCRISSGVSEGMTTGTPIHVFVPNTDQRGLDYSEMSVPYRPSHADATYDMKYGVRSVQGGGRSSARETIGRVAPGALAKKILKQFAGTEGLGTPVFDKLEAELAKACMSLPATKGFEFGSGFSGTFLTGLEHNDEFYTDENGRIRTKTNRSGGIQGGISNGEIINMRVAFKPTSTIGRKQNTVTRDKQETEMIAPVPMVEAMVALVLVDQLMAQYAQCHLFPINPELQEPFLTASPVELEQPQNAAAL